MKVVVPRHEFQDALAAASHVVAGRAVRPILSCVKLSVGGDDAVELCATDGETALRLSLPVLSVERAGEVVAPVDRLLGIARELRDVEIALEVQERSCTIRGEGSEFKIFVMDPGDFPPVPLFGDDPDVTMPGALLRRMVGMTLYAAARETSRFAINGALLQKRARRIAMVATDGRRLARAAGELPERSARADFEVILSAKALSAFEKVFAPRNVENDWTVDLRLLPNQILLRSGGGVLASALVEGHFPDYDKVIPTESNTRVRLGREEFLGAVRRAALLTTEESRAVRLAFEDGRLVITSQAPEHGQARIQMPIRFEGQPVEMWFNPNFLSDALRIMTQDEVTMELQNHERPGVLYGEDRNEFQYVVMPVSQPA